MHSLSPAQGSAPYQYVNDLPCVASLDDISRDGDFFFRGSYFGERDF